LGTRIDVFSRPERAAKLPFQGAVLVCCLLPNATHWAEINMTFSHFAVNLLTLLSQTGTFFCNRSKESKNLFLSGKTAANNYLSDTKEYRNEKKSILPIHL
jgi:hypothetical protein